MLCNCGDAYKYYVCVHSGVVSMLLNPEITFPNVERAHLLKAKQTKKSSNPFDAVAKRNRKEKIAQPSGQDDSKVVWKPVLPTYSAPLEDRGAGMAAKSRSMGRSSSGAHAFLLNQTSSARILPRSSCSRPSAGWARSSAGLLLLDLRVVQATSIHRSTVASLRVTGTRVRHNMAGGAPARSTAQ
jgi:hypothetical protein